MNEKSANIRAQKNLIQHGWWGEEILIFRDIEMLFPGFCLEKVYD